MERAIFTPFENTLLLELIRKKQDVVECKITNKVSCLQKNQAFLEIAEEFNATVGVTRRTATQLRQRYNNLKKKATKNYAQNRANFRATGGGYKDTTKDTTGDGIEDQVMAMGVLTQPLSTPFDSDSCFMDDDAATEESLDTSLNATTIPLPSPDHSKSTEMVDEELLQPVLPNSASTQSNNTIPTKPPNKTTQDLIKYFRNKRSTQQRTETCSSRAAKAILEETAMKKQLDKARSKREETEHELKVELLKKKIEVENKKLEIQTELLERLKNNPGFAGSFLQDLMK